MDDATGADRHVVDQLTTDRERRTGEVGGRHEPGHDAGADLERPAVDHPVEHLDRGPLSIQAGVVHRDALPATCDASQIPEAQR